MTALPFPTFFNLCQKKERSRRRTGQYCPANADLVIRLMLGAALRVFRDQRLLFRVRQLVVV